MTTAQKYIVFVVILAVAVGGLIAYAVVGKEGPTEADTNKQFCDAVGVFLKNLRELQDLDRDTPLSEVRDTTQALLTSYDDMIAAASAVAGARLGDLQEANNQLVAALEEVHDEATLGEALDSVKDEAQDVAIKIGQLLNDVGCGPGSGGQERSGE